MPPACLAFRAESSRASACKASLVPTVAGSSFSGWQSSTRERLPALRLCPPPSPSLQPHSPFSQQSDSSYDFLSAEEKECLLFLEKTIGSLEAEADSGLSTDESEPATSPQSFRALPTTTQRAPQGKRLSRDQSLLNTSHLACHLGQVPRQKKGALYSPRQTKGRVGEAS